MVNRLRAEFPQLLGIQVSWINIHGSRIAIWGLTVKSDMSKKWLGYGGFLAS